MAKVKKKEKQEAESKPEKKEPRVRPEAIQTVAMAEPKPDAALAEEASAEKGVLAGPETEGKDTLILGRGISKPAALLLIVLLIVAIVAILLVLSQQMGWKSSGTGTKAPEYQYYRPGDEVTGQGNGTGQNATALKEACLVRYGIDQRTVVFTYLPTCPYCKEMMPVISALSTMYSFKWADRSNVADIEMLNDCFSGTLKDVVPQLICPKTLKDKTGSLTSDEIAAFAEECRSS